ncbi:MAG TPA: thiamine-phosphate kinase [Pseudolabrys sp.]|nr:thiamine-phosphate kinase [Pseudolabrys sp.]
MTARDSQASGEDRLIARFFKPLATAPGALGLGDDAAFMKPPPGCDLVLTADALVGGVHFFADDEACAVAQKALRVNLSDLAAKGAKPLGYLLSLALPETADETWLASFANGLQADADQFACPLFGGDTVRTGGPVTVSIAMFGSVPEGGMVRRSGGKPGDVVMITGTIGDAALGLELRRGRGAGWKLTAAEREHLLARYLAPQPRCRLADAVRAYASAAMDVSDGLVGDFAKLARASAVAAEVRAEQVPVSEAARAALKADPGLLEGMLTGGDDYEIVCTVSPAKVEAFEAAAREAGISLTAIGKVMAGEGVRFLGAEGKPLSFGRPSFSHF